MASFVDSVRTVMGSRSAAFKMLLISALFSYPLFRVVSQPFQGWTNIWTIASIVMAVFYIGYIICAASNLINERKILLPWIGNPAKILLAGVSGILTLVPIIAGMYYGGYALYDLLLQKGLEINVVITLVVVAEFMLFGIFAVQLCMFANRYNPLDSFHLLKILKTFPEFSFRTLYLIIGILCLLLVMIPIGYLTYIMFGQDVIFFMVCVYLLTIILIFATQYYAQIYMENIVLYRKVDYEDDAGKILDKDLLMDK